MSLSEYSNVTPDQLEIQREPRKSRFTVLHKPSGSVGETPVTPGSHEPARFRRPTTVPKENRVPDMDGFIEGSGDDGAMFPIIGGETPRNEYLDKLVADEEALRQTFEGIPAEAQPETEMQPVPGTEQEPAAEEAKPVEPEDVLTEEPSAPAAEPEATEPEHESEVPPETTAPDNDESVDPEVAQELDDILAGMDP